MSIFTLIQAGLLVGGSVFIVMLFRAWRRNRKQEADTRIIPVALIGGFANFCDTLGVGSFFFVIWADLASCNHKIFSELIKFCVFHVQVREDLN